MTLLWVDNEVPPCEAFPDLPWRHAKTLAEAPSRLAHEGDVDLVFIELGLADGVDAIRQLRAAAPLATLIALSADERRGTVMGAISAGAAGFITRAIGADAMRAGVRTVLDGGIPLPITLLERRVPDRPGHGTWTPTPRTPDALGYTLDEAEVLRLLIQGRPEPLIAQALGLPEASVTAHLVAILRRLNAGSRSQAVLEAARLGLRFGPRQAGARASSIASP